MNLLITNDDGWGFEGIKALEKVASQFGTVWTVAPDGPMSGISHQLTFDRPLSLLEKAPRSFALDGTPADCVRVALTQLGVSFDWVLSGINKGANVGADIYVSGTIAAAREASLFRCRSIALSQHLRQFADPVDWSYSAQMAARVLSRLMSNPIPEGRWVNVNFPDPGQSVANDVSLVETENDRIPLPSDYVVMVDGKLFYNSVYNDRDRTPSLDVDVCFSGNASITFH